MWLNSAGVGIEMEIDASAASPGPRLTRGDARAEWRADGGARVPTVRQDVTSKRQTHANQTHREAG